MRWWLISMQWSFGWTAPSSEGYRPRILTSAWRCCSGHWVDVVLTALVWLLPRPVLRSVWGMPWEPRPGVCCRLFGCVNPPYQPHCHPWQNLSASWPRSGALRIRWTWKVWTTTPSQWEWIHGQTAKKCHWSFLHGWWWSSRKKKTTASKIASSCWTGRGKGFAKGYDLLPFKFEPCMGLAEPLWMWQDTSCFDSFLARIQVCGSFWSRWPSPRAGGKQARYVVLMWEIHSVMCFNYFLSPFETLPGRSLSEYQEAAQYLAGTEFPRALLEGLVKKATISSKCLGVVNLTPYDSHLEKVCLLPLGFKYVPINFYLVQLSLFICMRRVGLHRFLREL